MVEMKIGNKRKWEKNIIRGLKEVYAIADGLVSTTKLDFIDYLR